MLSSQQRLHDFADLRGRFAFSENDFREALAQGAVVVHFGEVQIFKGQIFQAFGGFRGSERAGAHLVEQFQQVGFGHELFVSLRVK